MEDQIYMSEKKKELANEFITKEKALLLILIRIMDPSSVNYISIVLLYANIGEVSEPIGERERGVRNQNINRNKSIRSRD